MQVQKYDAVFDMLAKIMDFDPRITSDGSGFGVEHGWGCNFSFGYGYDIIDEDTENKKCCVQALQFLIAKADAEICDLEDELAILQCQRKWAESDEQRDPYKVCCTTFKQKIDFLTSSIRRLSDGNVLSGHPMDETLELQRPPERIYDIINALISDKFSISLPDEQVVLDEKNPLANLGSPNDDIDLMQQTAGFESSMDSEEPMEVIERQPVHTVSEESSSDAARHLSKDSKDERDVGKSDIEVVGRAELDADRCTSEQRIGLLTVKPVMTPTHLQASGEGNPMSDALGRGETEECLTGSKIGENQLTTLSVKIEPVVKFEDDYDLNIQHVAMYSLPKMPDHEIEDPVEDYLKETENQSQNLVNTHITYNRRKLGSSSTFKGQKVQRKTQSDLGGIEPSSPSLTLKALRKIGKRESRSNAKSFGKICVPSSSKVEGMLPVPEFNWQRTLRINEGKARTNTSGVLGAKRRQILGSSRESSSIESPQVKVSNTTEEAFGTKSLNGRHMFLTSPELGEIKGSVATSSSANDQDTIAEDPNNDLENLRLKLSEDPEFLNKLKVSELKAIMKQNKMRGSYKLKKEKIVEELTKRLSL